MGQLILLFSVYLGWLPSAGGISRSGLKALILPAVALGWFFVAAHMRIVRSSMLEVLNSEYIKLRRGKGMPRRECDGDRPHAVAAHRR